MDFAEPITASDNNYFFSIGCWGFFSERIGAVRTGSVSVVVTVLKVTLSSLADPTSGILCIAASRVYKLVSTFSGITTVTPSLPTVDSSLLEFTAILSRTC